VILTADVLDTDTVAEIRGKIDDLDLVDGTTSARGGAKLVKQNRQSRPDDPAAAAIHRTLESRILDHDLVGRHAVPRAIIGARINHYTLDGHYGLHVDQALMSGHRTDLSFTLFLSDPTDYDGGELHLADGATSPRFKLPAGHVVLYPTRLLHQVTPVTRGERWAFVGWIESWIADPELRDAIAKVRSLAATLGDHPLAAIARLQLAEVEHTLLRIGSR
jgi:PKHD-type hydroxylase